MSPDKNDYILVFGWTSGNEKIDNFIQENQIEIKDTVFEWIPYNHFNKIEKTGKCSHITVYSAIWRDSLLLHKNRFGKNYTRDSNKEVALKFLHNLQNPVEFVINEAINTVFEWIPYSHLNKIEKLGKFFYITVYSAIWKNDPFYYDGEYTRDSNIEVALKLLHNLQNPIESIKNEVKKYSTKYESFLILYGISQNPDTSDYILVQNNTINLTNWISGNEKIDDFIQERQLKVNDYSDVVFEWIPYSQFNEIKKTGKNSIMTVYSAIWKDGPLCYNGEYTRDSNKEVALKLLHKNTVDFIINEAKKYSTKNDSFLILYGISQSTDSNDYILVQNNSINLTNWISENEKIDDFIQEMQLKINNYNDVIVEWIPFDQFKNNKKIGNGGFSTVYSAEWKGGPLEYDADKKIYKRNPNQVIALKCLYNSQNITNEFLNEVKEYSIAKGSNILNIHGISQNPDTKDYIMVLKYVKVGSFNDWINVNFECFNWQNKLFTLLNIINGLKEIHQNQRVHGDFHAGNILFSNSSIVYISDMGLCKDVSNVDKTNIYGVIPYMAPEVLRGKPYTQAADIYSFGMIMYFVATGRQPFVNCAHDKVLALDICKGSRPEINEPEAPKCYIELMNKCWNSNPNNRPNVTEVGKSISLLLNSIYVAENNEIEIKLKKQKNLEKQFFYLLKIIKKLLIHRLFIFLDYLIL
ncbi:unnamed protein product [Rhizophagus irregularis]|nr:unnamed protein product [Rhizophagus irregularis]